MESGKMRTFLDLECYKKCRELRIEIGLIAKALPEFEKYRLCDQMIRCSRSITNNIAEGFGRFHYKENAQFCRQSRGSLYELMDHLLIAEEEQYILRIKREELMSLIEVSGKLLNGYINYLVNKSGK